VHRWSAGVRPIAGSAGRAKELSLGYGMDWPEEGKRRQYLFAQVPLPFFASANARWDLDSREALVGLTLQATAQSIAGWGLKRPRAGLDEWKSLRHRELALRFFKARKTSYLLSPGGKSRIAELDLNRPIVEGESPRSWLPGTEGLGFLELSRRLDVIEADPAIKAVIVRLGGARSGWGLAEEIRNRLLGIRAKGKRVVAYLDQATPLNYYLASAADVVAMQPGGHFQVSGFSSEAMFYRGFFDKIGVLPQFLRHGRYKSFEEPYTRTGFSPEARANLESYLGSMWDHYLDAVASARKLQRDSVARHLSSGEISLDSARAAGLIDTLVQQDEVLEIAGGKHAALDKGGSEGLHRNAWNLPPRIALVIVKGDMVMGRSAEGWLGSPELAGAKTVAAQLRRARLDPGIRAVVIRVESPGGSAQAADVMAREVELLRKDGKPVVGSIGHMAASGGYYLLAGADRILCAHNSAVGSIGILYGKFVLNGLFGKVGLSTETVKTAPHADANSLSRPWDSAEVAILQRHMDDFYDRFVSKVVAGRKLTREQVDSVAQGRVFTGTQAVKVKLADRIGGLEESVAEAARLAGLGEGRDVELDLLDGGPGSNWTTGVQAVLESAASLASGESGSAVLESRGAAEALARWAGHYRELAEGQLLAVNPELAGWTATDLK
jgi:protease-4